MSLELELFLDKLRLAADRSEDADLRELLEGSEEWIVELNDQVDGLEYELYG